MVTYILLLHVITNEKTLKLKQIGRLPALPRFPPQKHVPTTLVGIPVDMVTVTLTPWDGTTAIKVGHWHNRSATSPKW